MSTKPKGTPTPEQAKMELMATLKKVADALNRIGYDEGIGELIPASCVYIDNQLAKSIAWLASARGIVITHAQLSDPAFDDGEVWDLDDQIGIVQVDDLPERTGGES